MNDGAIRIERDPAFWIDVASHPAVAPALLGLDPSVIGTLVVDPRVLPLASTNGGYLLARLDPLGRVLDLHALFKPDGWGREAHRAAKAALHYLFEACDVITSLEVASNPRSQPPRSFGFILAAPWRTTQLGPARTWILSRARWLGSPGSQSCPQSSSRPP